MKTSTSRPRPGLPSRHGSLLSPRELEAAARVLHAAAHPVRLGVLQLLADGEQTVTDLYHRIGCSQSMMSQQLRLLETQGLVAMRREGRAKRCRLGNPDFLNLFHCLQGHLRDVLHLSAADAAPGGVSTSE